MLQRAELGDLQVAARTREEEAGFKTEQREKMMRAIAEHEVSSIAINRELQGCVGAGLRVRGMG